MIIAAQCTATFLKIYCAPPNLGIRTWKCQLNFVQRPIFSGLRFFKSQTEDPSLKSLPEDLCSEFLRPEKIHQPQPGLNPPTLDLEASTLPQDHRGRLKYGIYVGWNFERPIYHRLVALQWACNRVPEGRVNLKVLGNSVLFEGGVKNESANGNKWYDRLKNSKSNI